MKLIVVGSINMDVVNRVHEHPVPGETISGIGTAYHSGGKGANQSVAASLSGSQVTFIGAVGTDAFAGELIDALNHYNVEAGPVSRKEGTSGMAFITVDDAGENTIIVSSGANGRLVPDDIQDQQHLFNEADALLLQNEIPWETTCFALKLAKKAGIPVFLNPAPAKKIPEEVLSDMDWLVLNEAEAEVITGMQVNNEDALLQAAKYLIDRGVSRVIVTLGGKGSFYLDDQGNEIKTPAFRVSAVDTTAAGDTFIGALASRFVEGYSIQDSITFASAAAAITVTCNGAQPSIPERAQVEHFLRELTSNH
jgi:ribokinase